MTYNGGNSCRGGIKKGLLVFCIWQANIKVENQ